MTPERWEEIKSTIKKQFSVAEQGMEDVIVETGEGPVKQGEAEFVVFDSVLGKTKLQFQKKPRLEEKKYFFSHRAGDSARVEYKFSDADLVFALKAYKWDDVEDDWKEIDASSFT